MYRLSLITTIALMLSCASQLASPAIAGSNTQAKIKSANDALALKTQADSAVSKRCREKAQVLWDSLRPEEQSGLREFIQKHDSLRDTVPSLVTMLKAGDRTGAVELVQKVYLVDSIRAGLIVSLVGYANGIE